MRPATKKLYKANQPNYSMQSEFTPLASISEIMPPPLIPSANNGIPPFNPFNFQGPVMNAQIPPPLLRPIDSDNLFEVKEVNEISEITNKGIRVTRGANDPNPFNENKGSEMFKKREIEPEDFRIPSAMPEPPKFPNFPGNVVHVNEFGGGPDLKPFEPQISQLQKPKPLPMSGGMPGRMPMPGGMPMPGMPMPRMPIPMPGMPGGNLRGMSRAMPVGMPGKMPGGMSGGMSGGMPGGMFGGMQGGMPGGMFGGMQGGMPSGSMFGGAMVGNIPQAKLESNIFEITFDELKKNQVIATGDSTQCINCMAYFSCISHAKDTWQCEFCNESNEVCIEDEEIPKVGRILYVLESIRLSEKFKKNLEKTIIFCIDISGSMCVTLPTQGKLNLRTNKLDKVRKELFNVVGPEWMAIDYQNITYVSRLECVQAAIDTQLTSLSLASPSSKVGLITFNNEVCIIGDGNSSLSVTGDTLNSFDKLLQFMNQKYNQFLSNPIGNSKDALCDKLFALEETGSTALGPALLLAVSLASQGGSGSKVIVCTDGVANTGIGNLEFDEDMGFYEKISKFAKDMGVEVSVISISDEECRLDALSKIVEQTGGELSKVNPQKIGEDFANILTNQIFATNANITVHLGDGLCFVNQDESNLKSETILYKEFGNVNNESIFTFEFQIVKDIKEKVPIQVVIDYKDMQGSKMVLVQTELYEVSENHDEVMKDANFDILAKNAQLQGASLVRSGDIASANNNFNKWQNIMSSNVQSLPQMNSLSAMIDRTTPLQNMIVEKLSSENEPVPYNPEFGSMVQGGYNPPIIGNPSGYGNPPNLPLFTGFKPPSMVGDQKNPGLQFGPPPPCNMNFSSNYPQPPNLFGLPSNVSQQSKELYQGPPSLFGPPSNIPPPLQGPPNLFGPPQPPQRPSNPFGPPSNIPQQPKSLYQGPPSFPQPQSLFGPPSNKPSPSTFSTLSQPQYPMSSFVSSSNNINSIYSSMPVKTNTINRVSDDLLSEAAKLSREKK